MTDRIYFFQECTNLDHFSKTKPLLLLFPNTSLMLYLHDCAIRSTFIIPIFPLFLVFCSTATQIFFTSTFSSFILSFIPFMTPPQLSLFLSSMFSSIALVLTLPLTFHPSILLWLLPSSSRFILL